MAEGYSISPAARRDLDEIWFFGAEEWSPDRADGYDILLHTVFEQIGENPLAGQAVPGRGNDIRRLLAGSHAVIYQSDASPPVILRVLHQRSDWQALFEA